MKRTPSPADEIRPRLPMAAFLGAAGASLALAAVVMAREGGGEAALAGLGRISGAPCPSVVQSASAELLKADQAFEFMGVDFGRRFGDADCDGVYTRDARAQRTYPIVCQFSNPAILTVRTVRGLYAFKPGQGRMATVSVSGGAARCVLASPYWTAYIRAATAFNAGDMRAVPEADADGKPAPSRFRQQAAAPAPDARLEIERVRVALQPFLSPQAQSLTPARHMSK
jgi:hypothetical protein